MKKLSILLLSLLIICSGTMHAQKKNPYTEPAGIVKKANPIVYLGADFSHVRITDASKVIKNSDYSSVYPKAWIDYIEKEMPESYVKKAIHCNNFIYEQSEIKPVSIAVSPEFIIEDPYEFNLDTLKTAVKKYTLSQKNGTGLVLIAENFSKPKEKASTWIVLFNIEDREILYSKKVSGKCSHMGYTAHWASGVIEGFKGFASKLPK